MGRCKQRSTEFSNLSLNKTLNCLTFSVLCQEENHLSLSSDICTVDRTSINRALSDYKSLIFLNKNKKTHICSPSQWTLSIQFSVYWRIDAPCWTIKIQEHVQIYWQTYCRFGTDSFRLEAFLNVTTTITNTILLWHQQLAEASVQTKARQKNI